MTDLEKQQAFEKFYQATSSAEGSGVGLSISKKIISDLGGKIRLDSSGLNNGTTITVELPKNYKKN